MELRAAQKRCFAQAESRTDMNIIYTGASAIAIGSGVVTTVKGKLELANKNFFGSFGQVHQNGLRMVQLGSPR